MLRDFDCMLLRDDRIGIVGLGQWRRQSPTLLNLIAGASRLTRGESSVGGRR